MPEPKQFATLGELLSELQELAKPPTGTKTLSDGSGTGRYPENAHWTEYGDGTNYPGEPLERQTGFVVFLMDMGANKIATIKAVREVTSLELLEARLLVDGAPAPLKTDLTKQEAAAIVKRFEGVAGIEIR